MRGLMLVFMRALIRAEFERWNWRSSPSKLLDASQPGGCLMELSGA